MDQNIILEDIEYTLSKLIGVLSEEEYIAFINSDSLLKLYDIAVEMMNPIDVFSEKALKKIDKYLNSKYELYK